MAPNKNSVATVAVAPTRRTVVKVSSKGETCEETCAICLDTLSADVTTLPCKHGFHKKCLRELRNSKLKQACPMCRRPLPPSAKELRRSKELSYHLALLEHSSRCKDVECPSNNCKMMKQEMIHLDECLDRAHCVNSTQMRVLIHMHARVCTAANCEVPKCNAIRERMARMERPLRAIESR